MDAATEVIVLDDSSDASSEGEMTRASASTTPPASPAMKWRRAQSVGYADAVEAALAMAASLETKEPSASRKTTKKKEKKVAPAPPLLPTKAKKLQSKQHNDRRPLQAVKNREKTVHRRSGRERQRSVQSSRSRKRSNSLSSSSDSDSSSSSSSESRRRPRFVVAGGGDRPSTASSGKSGLSARRRSSASASGRHQVEGRRRASAGAQPRVKSKQPAEVVDLLSSSSSSESSVRCRSRSSSVSSLTSSDNESVTRTPVKTAKKRLVLNERVSKPRPDTISGSKSAETVGSLCPKQSTGNPMPAGKRKRVLPQMRREISGGVKKRDRDPGDQLTKQKSGKKKPVGSGARSQDSVSKLSTATQNAPVSLLSSSSSDSSDSSSPPSSPRPVPARKSVTTPSTAPQSTGQAREGETDAFGRYHCRKSVPGGANSPPGKAKSVSPSSAPAVSANSLSSPSPSPSPRKKRRVLTYFDTDHVALDDLQAQERELAWIRSQRKQTQTQNRSRSTKTAVQKRKTSQEVIYMDDHSDASSAVNSEERAHGDGQPKQSKTKVKLSATADRTPLDSCNAMLHATSYRGVYFDEAPPNILPSRGQTCSVPFELDCDHPLTFYDETDTLASHCSILESFGKPTQCISSVFPSEVAKPQSDVTRAVSSLVMAHLPIIRRCHRKKVQAMLSEARKKIAAYQAALKKHKQTPRGQNVMTSHLLPRSTAEKHVIRQLKAVQHTCSQNAGSVSFQIGRGDAFVQERTVSSLIQINCIEETRPLRKYTTSIGLRANYRVEDDPILRYTVSTRPSETDGGDELAKKYGLQIGSVADEEVAEFMLRLVVGRLGDSEQVFHALKSELGFSQAYTAYCELKKLHDSRQRARTRLDRIEKLRGNGEHSSDPDVAAIVKLLEQSSFSKASRSKTLSRRLQPPICNLESSIVDSLVDGATAGMVALGLRASDSYNELVDVYYGSFCRMCYRYACHEHGGDHPLPARRVDPVYPRAQLTAASCDRSGAASSDEDVICLGSEVTGEARHFDTAARVRREAAVPSVSKVQQVGVESDMDMSDGGSGPQQRRRQRKTMADPSEYLDASHVSLVAEKMHSFLSVGSACGKLCWKNDGRIHVSAQRTTLSAAELGVIRKLRETMGDNSCLLSAIVGSAYCIEVHELIKKEQANVERGGVADGVGRSEGRRVRNWKRGRRSGGSNHELLQRTRNQRLQDRGTENHEYQPCMHEGMCDSTGCSCMKRDHMCEKACACSRDCPNRFEGCSCSPGECRTSKCPCFAALRECAPDTCISCGASEVAVSVATDNSRCAISMCGNVNVTRSKHKRLGMRFSPIHGYGMYAREAISATEYVYEYTGAMVSQDEAERRGLIYDTRDTSYLFDLNEDAVLDALRCGSKSKFINHDGEVPNCTAKVVSVCGVHHITIWALRNIAVGEELVFDYGYKRSVGPDWSQRRAASKDSKDFS
ncbi:hypothetical protein Pcac1_g17446 [Phytophthora cactorum]|nr:hypothetical protein Pcac1_g17446 [Phytophthora cactorum]